jgi:hypothetical protein
VERGCRRVNLVGISCTYVSGKMRPIKTIPGMEGGGQKRMMEGLNSTTIYCKYLCQCHNVPPAQ